MNFRTFTGLAAGAAALSIGATPALADDTWTGKVSVFSACDGYGMPSSGGDGMTRYAMVLGIFSPPGYGTTAMVEIGQRGARGVVACDAALSAAQLQPAHWLRKVNLLQARALHQLEQNNYAAALADIEQARAAVQTPDDPFYARSLGISLDLVEAYAQGHAGDKDKTSKLVFDSEARRPFSRQVGWSGTTVLQDFGSDADIRRSTQNLARLDPRFLSDLYEAAFSAMRWQEMVDIYPQLGPPRLAGYTLSGEPLATVDGQPLLVDIQHQAQLLGPYAYALAATGRGTEARKVLTDARASLSLKAQPAPPPAEPSPGQAENASERENPSRGLARQIGALLNSWEEVVELRTMIDEGKVDAVLQGRAIGASFAWPIRRDLQTALADKIPANNAKAIAQLAVLFPPSPPVVAPLERNGPTALFETLPKSEIASKLPRYKPASRSFLWGEQDGFSVKPSETIDPVRAGGDVMMISFLGSKANDTVVEEMSLLRAADLARQSGKKGIVILEREDLRRTLTLTYHGRSVRTDPQGFSTTLTVVLVDPANLPEPYRSTPWRVIDADSLYEALAPLYAPATAAK